MLRNASPEDQAKAIHSMRTRIRKQFTDIRTNSIVTKAMWAFIDSVSSGPGIHGNRGSKDAGEKQVRRKRKDYDNESEEEYRPSPIKSFGRTPKTRSKHKD